MRLVVADIALGMFNSSSSGYVLTPVATAPVVRALAAGVPMVVLPHGRDQADNGARLTVRHAGIVIKRTASPAAIARG